MTNEQLTLARQFAEAVGWKLSHTNPELFYLESTGHTLSWLFTGDGMLAVKAEMAKRDKPLASLQDSKLAMAWWPIHDVSRASFADSEPHAVLLAAVAAMKGDNGQA